MRVGVYWSCGNAHFAMKGQSGIERSVSWLRGFEVTFPRERSQGRFALREPAAASRCWLGPSRGSPLLPLLARVSVWHGESLSCYR